jgi:hypothetical protein
MKIYRAGPQLEFTFNNRFSRTGWAVSQSVRYIFFRHQACYSLLPAKPGGQADLVISLCKYKVVGQSFIVYSLCGELSRSTADELEPIFWRNGLKLIKNGLHILQRRPNGLFSVYINPLCYSHQRTDNINIVISHSKWTVYMSNAEINIFTVYCLVMGAYLRQIS